MSKLRRHFRILSILLILIWQSCAGTIQQRNASDHSNEIQKLKTALRTNPNDVKALRDLGAVYYDGQQYKLALACLTKAFKQNPGDPKCMAYLGMTLEAQHKNNLALKFYKNYSKLPLLSSYRKTMQGRYYLLTRKVLHDQIRSLMAREEGLGATQLSPQAIAVFPLEYEGNNPEYAPLGKGISEMMISDLSQVPGLTLIERVRLQALLEELALGQSGIIDESTAPHLGRLLSAGKIIHGNYDTESGKKLKINLAFWDMVNQQTPQINSKNETLQNLFYLEKDLVFDLIDEMGIKLTPQQREKIQFIPTKNMQAFMAYCMGLDKEDAGQFSEAAQWYQQAVQLDPNLKIAREKLEMNEAVAMVESAGNKLLTKADSKDNNYISAIPLSDLVSNRLQNLSISIGSNFLPGQDSRKPLEEAVETSANIGLGNLPEPPAPPIRR